MRSWTSFLAIVLLAWSGVASAATTRISGTIKAFDGTTLTVLTKRGETVAVRVPSKARIGALVGRTLGDIKPGEFVGSAAIERSDGKLYAQEVHIFPESMRGTGEGHNPMSEPKQTMTNATVARVMAAPQGRTLRLTYKGGGQDIVVAPGARIVGMIEGDVSLLKSGAAVFILADKADDGRITARYVQAEKNGVKPLF